MSTLSSHRAAGWLLERPARAALSPEARGFSEARPGLGVRAGAKVSAAVVVLRHACGEEAPKDQAGKFCSCVIRIGV